MVNYLSMTYPIKTFKLPTLEGISEKQVKVHLALYEGYVKNINLIMEKLEAVREGTLDLDPYIVAELRRHFAFEFDGMRMHEYYFEQFEPSTGSGQEGQKGGNPESGLAKAAAEKY